MSSTSMGKSSPRRVPRTSTIRARQRSMMASFAITTSRSTTACPSMDSFEQGPFGLAAEDLQVFIHTERTAEERISPLRIAVGEETAVLEDLHPQDGRDRIKIHEVYG